MDYDIASKSQVPCKPSTDGLPGVSTHKTLFSCKCVYCGNYFHVIEKCTCILCGKAIHEFREHKCIRCGVYEPHAHQAYQWSSYTLVLKENKLYYRMNCSICHERFLQEKNPAQKDHSHSPYQPFVFRNGMKAYTGQELVELCYQFPEDGCYHLLEGHFEPWFNYLQKNSVTTGNVPFREMISICREVLTFGNEWTPKQKLAEFINRFCALDVDNSGVIDDLYDGQSWVAGWD